MIYDHTFRVRYAETDQMGIAHHAVYLIWFEMARVEWIRALGLPWGDIESSGYANAVYEARQKFRSPARFDQLLVMRVAFVTAHGPRLRFAYRLHDSLAYASDGETAAILAVGSIELVWVTRDGRPTRLPRDHPATALFATMAKCPDWDL